ADVRLALGAEPPRRLRLEQRADEWWRDAEPLGIDGCPDVDLVVTPATNTLPIRRLGLQAGETATIRALWIRVPSLELVVAEQEYACHAPGRYRYRAGSFAADLEVDEDGLVVDYAGIWRRAAEETAPGRPRGGPVG
ncbi:MAG TPA: putative glycolipid-binding domain-containing protein, partial [Candidatus Limnocylindrales bacterium]